MVMEGGEVGDRFSCRMNNPTNFMVETWPRVDEMVAEWLERLSANADVVTVLGSISASSDSVESERRQMTQFY
jgi:hypothetical protein